MFILTGKVYQENKDWLIECPAIDAHTFGHSKNEALELMIDCVRCLIDEPNFELEISENDGIFEMEVKNYKPIIRLMLERAKAKTDLTFDDIANNLGLSSRSSVAKTMKIKHDIQLSKLVEVLESIGFDLEVSIKPKRTA